MKNYGEVKYYIDGSLIATSNLIANKEVKKLTFSNMLAHVFGDWINVLR